LLGEIQSTPFQIPYRGNHRLPFGLCHVPQL
jgi:hypothetical protein